MLRYISMAVLGLIMGLSLTIQYYAATVFMAIFAAIWMLGVVMIICTIYLILELREHRPTACDTITYDHSKEHTSQSD